jgi:thiol-disulfide isomerase/thioredoxin
MVRFDLPYHVILCLAVGVVTPAALADFDIPFDDYDIPVSEFTASGGPRIVWLPAEFGNSPRHAVVTEALTQRGVEVWRPDLHSAWFLPTGRHSLDEVEPAAIARIIETAVRHDERPVYLMAEGRGVKLALQGVRQWQADTDATSGLRGLIALYPKLIARMPQGAEEAEYLPAVSATNLPVYLMQPHYSAGFWHIAKDMRELGKGGAPVFLHHLRGVSDGFLSRPDCEAGDDMARRLPAMLTGAMALLDDYDGTPSAPAPMTNATPPPARSGTPRLLRPFADQAQAPVLQLPSLRGGDTGLADHTGKVVLVHFWATWCPPCIQEVPSLQRLYERSGPHGLEILAVDVGESGDRAREFLNDKAVDFPVLIDGDGATMRRWGVRAFPTTLVLDRAHRIRYAVFGAFDWDTEEATEVLRPLLAEPTAQAATPDRDRPAVPSS